MTLTEAVAILNDYGHHGHSEWHVDGEAFVSGKHRHDFYLPSDAIAIAGWYTPEDRRVIDTMLTRYEDYLAKLPPEEQAAIKVRADKLREEDRIHRVLVDFGFESDDVLACSEAIAIAE